MWASLLLLLLLLLPVFLQFEAPLLLLVHLLLLEYGLEPLQLQESLLLQASFL